MTRGAQKSDGEVIAEPAVLTPMHVQDRKITDGRGREILGKAAWRNETQFQRACRLAQLVDKSACTDERMKALEIDRALDRRDAGIAFVEAWDIRERGTKDSTDMSRGGSPASADGMTVARIAAAKLLASWQAHMGANDWMLVRRVCGENYAVAQAVASISPAYKFSALTRFREAMDGLIQARFEARKCEWCRRNKPHGSTLEI